MTKNTLQEIPLHLELTDLLVNVEITLLQVLRPVHPYVISGYEVPDFAYAEDEVDP